MFCHTSYKTWLYCVLHKFDSIHYLVKHKIRVFGKRQWVLEFSQNMTFKFNMV